ncbi:MAG: ArsR/SmtB family transcription factor [Dermatophilaceae bacterium]
MSRLTPIALPVAAPPASGPEAIRVAEVLAAMAHPARVRILTALETVCVPVNSVVEATGLRQPTVSHHLRILREGGLVIAERRGLQIYYCLTDHRVTETLDAARGLAGLDELRRR